MRPTRSVREIVFAPSDPNVVYAETDGYVLYRSDDAGQTWRLMVHVRDEVLNVQPYANSRCILWQGKAGAFRVSTGG